MKTKQLSVIVLGLIIGLNLQAQELLQPFYSISHKKTTYVTMEDGKEIEGNVKSLDRKKGLIEEVKIKTSEGKQKIDAAKIKYAYFPQSGWDKYAKAVDFMSDAQQWGKMDEFDNERLKDGYAYFELADVQVKKKERKLLMQLLNPGSCTRIKVYHDPFAGETASLGVAGIKVAGGDAKSYYVSKDGEVAYKLKKKDYAEMFEKLFGDCAEVKEKHGEKARWSDFVEAIFAYNQACANK